MSVLRLILLLVILGGLTLFTLQNWSPSLSLVFLGARTLTAPLALWILGAIAAGALTTLLLIGLLRLADYWAGRSQKGRSFAVPPPRSPRANSADDEDEFDFEEEDEEPEDQPPPKPVDRYRDPAEYEVRQQPRSGQQSGSVYSYSYREPEDIRPRRTEDVYDADFRVIRPPDSTYVPPPPSRTEEPEEWAGDDWLEPNDEDW